MNIAIFEVGKGYGRAEDRPHEWWRLGIALAGSFDVPAWNRDRRAADLSTMSRVSWRRSRRSWGSGLHVRLAALEPTLHPGRAAVVTAIDDAGAVAISGVLGEVHPAAGAAWDERHGNRCCGLSCAACPPAARPCRGARRPHGTRRSNATYPSWLPRMAPPARWSAPSAALPDPCSGRSASSTCIRGALTIRSGASPSVSRSVTGANPDRTGDRGGDGRGRCGGHHDRGPGPELSGLFVGPSRFVGAPQ